MEITMRQAFAKALKTARKAHGLTQEDFSSVSSRTYVSTLERGQKSPTLDKIGTISQTIGINHLSLLTLAHLYFDKDSNLEAVLEQIRFEINHICENSSPSWVKQISDKEITARLMEGNVGLVQPDL
jgi:transcriptional regulator with XRE-family HTH domain